MKKDIQASDQMPGVVGSTDIDMPMPIGVAGANTGAGDDKVPNPMTANDGSNPSIPDAPFADGKDMRNAPKSQGSNPWPAMPGC